MSICKQIINVKNKIIKIGFVISPVYLAKDKLFLFHEKCS